MRGITVIVILLVAFNVSGLTAMGYTANQMAGTPAKVYFIEMYQGTASAKIECEYPMVYAPCDYHATILTYTTNKTLSQLVQGQIYNHTLWYVVLSYTPSPTGVCYVRWLNTDEWTVFLFNLQGGGNADAFQRYDPSATFSGVFIPCSPSYNGTGI